MSEYWVSQAKFYCKFCNVWIADNKPTRQLHDGGAKHKFNVDEFHKKKRNEKLFGARSEGEIRQQLAEIERAAKEAVAADRLEENGLFYSKPVNVGLGPPPPPPRPSSSGGEAKEIDYSESRSRRGQSDDVEKEEKIEEDDTGAYTVDGQTYLEGPKYEDILTRGMNCEIFVEDTDEWYAAVIIGRKDIAVPHTEIILRTFEVTYIRIVDPVGETENANDVDDEKVEKGGECSGVRSEGVTGQKEENEIIGITTHERGIVTDVEMEEDTVIRISETGIDMRTVGNVVSEGNPIVKKKRTSRWDNQSTALPCQPSFSSTLLDSSHTSIKPLPPLPIEISIPPPPPPLPPKFPPAVTTDMIRVSTLNTANNLECEVTFDVHSDIPLSVINTTFKENEEDIHKNQIIEEEKEPIVETVVISGIRSDHLRLLCDNEGNVFGASGKVVFQVASMVKAPPLAVVDQSTGYSAWQTVSVQTIDEEEEALLREEEAIRLRDRVRNQALGITKIEEISTLDKDTEEEDVMSTFDPYGTNMYKGMKVNDDEGHQENQTMSKKGEKVGFKKRKKIGSSVSNVTINGSNSSSSSSSRNEEKSDISRNGCNISIKIERNHHSDEIQIKEESNFSISSLPPADVSRDRLTDAVIKTEIKLEPKIELLLPAVKMSFGFNATKKLRKS